MLFVVIDFSHTGITPLPVVVSHIIRKYPQKSQMKIGHFCIFGKLHKIQNDFWSTFYKINIDQKVIFKV